MIFFVLTWWIINEFEKYISGPVHTTPEEFENGGLFLRLDLPSTLIWRNWRHNNQVICLPESSSNTNSKWRLRWWLPCWFRHVGTTKTSLVHSSVSAAYDWCVFKILRRSVDRKHSIRFLVYAKNIWCVFRVKHPFSNSSGVVRTGPQNVSEVLV